MDYWNAAEMMWRLIFVHTLIKLDLQGFSHLPECAPLAVKLNPALSEHMASLAGRHQRPFDGCPFHYSLVSVGSDQRAVSGLITKFNIFLFACCDKHSVRAWEQTASAVDAVGQQSQLSFTPEQFYIMLFVFIVTSR